MFGGKRLNNWVNNVLKKSLTDLFVSIRKAEIIISGIVIVSLTVLIQYLFEKNQDKIANIAFLFMGYLILVALLFVYQFKVLYYQNSKKTTKVSFYEVLWSGWNYIIASIGMVMFISLISIIIGIPIELIVRNISNENNVIKNTINISKGIVFLYMWLRLGFYPFYIIEGEQNTLIKSYNFTKGKVKKLILIMIIYAILIVIGFGSETLISNISEKNILSVCLNSIISFFYSIIWTIIYINTYYFLKEEKDSKNIEFNKNKISI